MDYDLFNFDPERHTGRNFSGWFHPGKRRAVFVPRMYHAQSVMQDGDYYHSTPETVGEKYGFARGLLDGLDPEAVYDLMFENGWVRFYAEYDAEGKLVMEGRDAKTLRGAQAFARFAGFPADKLRLRQRTVYDEISVEISF